MQTRLAHRINVNFNIIFRVCADPQRKFAIVSGKSLECKAFDISELGVGLSSKYFFPKGLMLDMKIDGSLFGLREAMNIRGEVRYCIFNRSYGYRSGIKFIDLADKYHRSIAKFIGENERRKDLRVQISD
ncbi:MAG: PilZ domain-containing protein [Candidatus Omnitrophota bacterium]|nr:PilZ domain-containing protein [Candidatus Omnitrophota bacterium]